MSELESWIASLRAEREKFDAVLARVSKERFEVAGVVGDWTVKDVLAHLTVRESRVITLLFQIERGGKVQPLESSPAARQSWSTRALQRARACGSSACARAGP